MADPRARLSEGLKSLTSTPPPKRAVPPPPQRPEPQPSDSGRPSPTTPDPPVEETPPEISTSRAGGGEVAPTGARSKPSRSPRRKATEQTLEDDDIIGRPLGNKRSVVVHLPLSLRETLDKRVEEENTTKGVIIMRTLREAHAELAKRASHHPSDPTPSSPFPAERPVRPRTNEKKVATTFTVFPDEAVALTQVARDLTDGNVSALVSDALELRLSPSP